MDLDNDLSSTVESSQATSPSSPVLMEAENAAVADTSAAPDTEAPQSTASPPEPTVDSDYQKELRRTMLQIHSDPRLSGQEKAKRMQALMTARFTMKGHHSRSNSTSSSTGGGRDLAFPVRNEQQQPDTPSCCHSETASAVDTSTDHDSSMNEPTISVKDYEGKKQRVPVSALAKSYHDEENQVFGCSHYQRSAKYQAMCCGKWSVCRFCHDEESDHHVNRHATQQMMCMHCNLIQPVAQTCVGCQQQLGRYYCDVCKLWDSDPKKNIYHCDKCGICRIGKGLGQDYFHCDKCNVCMAIHLKDNHRCIERNLESDCPICGEYMFTSTHTVIFMPCGHCIHWRCYQEHIKSSYQCPICWKSLADMTQYFQQIDRMLEQHQMPPEYKDFWSFVLCNDCEKKSKTKYHFLYHKCQHCRSYNTKLLQTIQETSDGTTTETLNELTVTEDGITQIRPRSTSAVSSESRHMIPDDNENRRAP